jgi:outer membrane protein assembly factor BamB
MTTDTSQPMNTNQPQAVLAQPVQPPRVWPLLVLVGLFWAGYFLLNWLDVSMFTVFLGRLAGCVLLLLLFTVLWFFNRRISWGDRLLGFSVALVGGIVAALLSGERANLIAWVLLSLPFVFTAWAVWMLAARWASARTRRLGLLAVLFVTWGIFTLLRTEGLRGNGEMVLHWRWTPTAEQLYLEELAQRQTAGPVRSEATQLTLHPGDWPGFRGPDREGAVHGITIKTGWDKTPPHLLWRQRIGPAWSSVAIVGGRLFTQEQRDQEEAVVCLDAATGRQVWVHTDPARFYDGQALVGPRASPTFADGRIYTLGATGILNCLDAATGARQWSHDIATDASSKLPIWGFSSSPLVAEGLVIVFAGGEGDKGLLAYRADSGQLAWTAAAGQMSYSSPQLAELDGQKQVLFLGDRGLTAFAPTTGAVLWNYSGEQALGLPRCTQPQLVGKSQILIGSEPDRGTVLLDVSRKGKSWSIAPRWTSGRLKPSFNDFVVHDNAIYGFDGEFFCCLDLKSGKRRWKDGRYGHGQVLLLADQPLLLVTTEDGEVVLVAADPAKHRELGRIQAIKGKTWNHPVIAHGRLYVRNAEEIACYQLEPIRTARADGKAASTDLLFSPLRE